MFVVVVNKVFDFGDQLFCAPKKAVADCFLRDMSEPSLDLVEP